MIITTITPRKKPVVYTPVVHTPVVPVHQGVVHSTAIYAEVRRREAIVESLFKAFPYKVNDIVAPADKQDLEKWGQCTIVSVVDNYIYLGKDFKWPKNDNPMIVTAASENGEMFFATTNYFAAKQ
jgi:hypothetical protein